MELPQSLQNRLTAQYGTEQTQEIIGGYRIRPVTLRVNSLKTTLKEVEDCLQRENIAFRRVEWYHDALVLEDVREDAVRSLSLYEEGKVYLQSLSSMLPPLVLAPSAGESILDMAAAPGGKTTQMSALSGGKSFITACERDKIRAERLKYNVERQGAPKVTVLCQDAAKLDDFFRFDKILLDAPCSGSGTVLPERRVDFNEKLLAGCVKTQLLLLKKALKLLKKGGTLVYSTCSILSQENEEMLALALKGERVRIKPITGFEALPQLPTKEGCLLVKPTALFEGFFVAKMIKE